MYFRWCFYVSQIGNYVSIYVLCDRIFGMQRNNTCESCTLFRFHKCCIFVSHVTLPALAFHCCCLQCTFGVNFSRKWRNKFINNLQQFFFNLYFQYKWYRSKSSFRVEKWYENWKWRARIRKVNMQTIVPVLSEEFGFWLFLFSRSAIMWAFSCWIGETGASLRGEPKCKTYETNSDKHLNRIQHYWVAAVDRLI